jgi:ATP-binding cassette subfamily B protein
MSRSEASVISNSYQLSKSSDPLKDQVSVPAALRRLAPLMSDEKASVWLAFIAVVVTSATSLLGPAIIALAVDSYIQKGDFNGVLLCAAAYLGNSVCNLFGGYFQTQRMGMVGRRVLFNLRNAIFIRLQQLPLLFFNQNKAGDLISRINNDTDKLNQFFSQALVQFASNIFLMTGAAIALVVTNPKLGLATLVPAAGVLLLTRLLSPWVRRRNVRSLQSLGGLSAEIQESLSNFRVILAFNRIDYFRTKFDEANEQNFKASVSAGLASNLFMPVYTLAHIAAQITVLAYGVRLIGNKEASVGVLIGSLLYVNSFYMPLRHLAAIWASFQLSLAAIDRISEVLALESNMPVVPSTDAVPGPALAFNHVSFAYPEGKPVLHDATFSLETGKTYALVGPTGGGKTTAASLMARLYDPVEGRVLLDGRDIRSYPPEERTRKIGFILQEPILFTGTIRDNILYGNEQARTWSDEELLKMLARRNLDTLLSRFEMGLNTPVQSIGDGISLGQKQIVAFMRAVLKGPDILILDEATANIDTVTEKLLEEILQQLPASTTKVIIAHRLNTIANADEIFFINSGEIIPAGSMEHAMHMLLHEKRDS